MLERAEKVREHPLAEMTTWIDWSLIFKDGRRVVIPEFSVSPWDSARVLPHFNRSDVMVLPIVGGLPCGSSDEPITEDSLVGEPGTIVMTVEDTSDTLEITHLAIDFSL